MLKLGTATQFPLRRPAGSHEDYIRSPAHNAGLATSYPVAKKEGSLILNRNTVLSFAAVALLTSAALLGVRSAAAFDPERVTPIVAPATPLPPEDQSRAVTRFSFIAYGDTRGHHDGTAIQAEHQLVVNSMLTRIKELRATPYPVRFILQSGDAVFDGHVARQWNVSFTPLINRLTTEGGVPYFLIPGNHEGSTSKVGARNYEDAVAALIPPEGSPRRMPGEATYSFGYGNTFVLALDSNIAADLKQYQWVKSQLEGLDRSRYVNVIVYCHHAPFSSGPHGGSTVERPTAELRSRYMPLFNACHVRVVFSGHEHFFEHWVEHYTDSSGLHRMDLVVSAGGGAPLYTYSGEPDLREFLKTNAASQVTLAHLVKPGRESRSNPHHYLIVRVDGDQLEMEVVGVDWGRDFQPYGTNKVLLQDPANK